MSLERKNDFYDNIRLLTIAVFYFVMFAYIVLLIRFAVFDVRSPIFDSEGKQARLSIGIPIAFISSIFIVGLFERSAKRFENSANDSNDNEEYRSASALSFKAFGLEFSGPAAPATLWIFCFLSIVFAIRLLSM